MKGAYDHKKIEKKWQKVWEDTAAFTASNDSTKEKHYVLDMFPYPSGSGLHVGHVEGYTATDIYSRYKRMRGYNVLHPMGWDAFGLPAENYAIKTGVAPQKTTDDAIENFRKQIKSLGLSYDWSREVGTHTPEYYKWTQWFFLTLYKNGFAEKRMAKVNWCPKDQTVLANEQTVSETGEKGVCVRCGTKVVQKDLSQWFFKITDFADQLVDDLDTVDWPESTKINQRNWIGRSEGAEIDFTVASSGEKIKVFTTRPDTIFGATYMVLAPEHSLVTALADRLQNKDEVFAYVEAAKNKTDLERQEESKDKTGVELKGVKAVNPATKEEIPVFIADYVLGGYGTGAIMAVPAHDERDFAFAKKFNLPIKYVVLPKRIDERNPHQPGKELVFRKVISGIIRNPKTGKYLVLNWKQQPWTTFVVGGMEEGETPEEAARREIAEETGYKNLKLVRVMGGPTYAEYYAAHKGVNRNVHNWLVLFELENEEKDELSAEEAAMHELEWVDLSTITRDRMAHAELDIMLERIQSATNDLYTRPGILIDSGAFSGLDSEDAKKKITEAVGGKMVKTYRLRDWLISRQRYWGAPIPVVYDPEGKPHPVPEEHLPWLLPTDVDYLPHGTSPLATSKELLERTEKIFGKGWKPEADTMDTFVCSSWYFFRFADPHNKDAFSGREALKKWMPVDLYMGGAEHTVLHLMYARFFTKVLQKLGYINFTEPFTKLRHQGLILAEDGSKMSKSKGNVINPDDVVDTFGADSVRMYEMFMGPLEAQKPWSTSSIMGVRRFLERAWKYTTEIWLENYIKDIKENPQNAIEYEKNGWNPKLENELQALILKVTNDIESLKFNTALSALMIYLNLVYEETKLRTYSGTEATMSKSTQMTKGQLETFIKLLSPFAPHIAAEMWESIGNTSHVWAETWPVADASKLASAMVTIAVQVNGKMRATIEIPADMSEEEALKTARSNEQVAKWIGQGKEKRAVYVPSKIISFVVE